jgi:hypothetical protein
VKSDIYSFGIILWEIFEEKVPFKESVQELVPKGMRPKISIESSKVMKILRKSWEQRP